MINNPPKDFEVEVTLIGTGGGYGESIILKIGIDSWIIVDSCINPSEKNDSLAIQYLKNLEIDLSKVVLIICTHWHNDHIKGLAKTLLSCPNAEFCFSSVNDIQKFLLLCELDWRKTSKGSIGSTTEFADCLKIVSDRNATCTKVTGNMVLFNISENNENFTLFSLTPSPQTVLDFDSEISELITEFGKRNTAVINKSPNEKSVALLLRFGTHRVLLGADLEIGKNDQEGWRYVLNHSKVLDDTKASLYKIPHHGSETAYLVEIFETLVNKNSILKITPFSPSSLPRKEMLEVYQVHSENIFITSRLNVSKKSKQRDKAIEKIIDRSVISLEEVKFSQGIIRSRINYTIGENSTWETETILEAFKY